MSMMKCPECGEAGTDVIHTRIKDGEVWRQHRCKNQGDKFATLELPEAEVIRLRNLKEKNGRS